jgi:hypothetical protein
LVQLTAEVWVRTSPIDTLSELAQAELTAASY